MAYTTRLVMKPKSEIIKRLNLEQKGKVQEFFTATCAKEMDKYVPFKSGDLATTVIQNGIPTTNVNEDTITYDQLYAQYQYKGVREDGTHKINEENRTRTMHPQATSYWDKVMWSNHKEKICKEVELAIERFAKK